MIILKNPYKILAFLITGAIIVAIIAAIIYYLVKNNEEEETYAIKGAVATNGHTCATIGASILKQGGSAVDSAIAALFCEGVSMPQSMGLGGGFLMTIYIRETKTAVTLNARESAPKAAHEDMFGGDGNLSSRGGLAVAVPGELKGYWEAHQRYGKMPWRNLVQPTIDLCKNGILVTEYLDKLYKTTAERLHQDPILRETYIDPNTNETYKVNEYVKRPRLAKTLELIAEGGADVLYNGSLTKGFVEDIAARGGIITEEDMNEFQIEWPNKTVTVNLPFKQTLYTSPLPGSGVILGFIMNILNDFLDYSDITSITNWQRIVESFKYGYGRRTELGDPHFIDISDLLESLNSPSYAEEIRGKISDTETFQNASHYGANTTQPEDHGTAHISVLAPNGDAVAVTSTINLYFGAAFMSNSTGIILNDEMDDFSAPNVTNSFDIPPSVANYIKPKKRPLSSMCPSIIVDSEGDVKLVIGAAGGTKITTSIALIAIKNLWFNMTISDAVAEKRLHHQLFPMAIQFEAGFENDTLVDALHEIGHSYTIASADSGFAAVTAISREGETVYATTDRRRSGETIYVY